MIVTVTSKNMTTVVLWWHVMSLITAYVLGYLKIVKFVVKMWNLKFYCLLSFQNVMLDVPWNVISNVIWFYIHTISKCCFTYHIKCISDAILKSHSKFFFLLLFQNVTLNIISNVTWYVNLNFTTKCLFKYVTQNIIWCHLKYHS